MEVLSRADVKEGKRLNDCKFVTFIGRFPSDGMASMAVKGYGEALFNGDSFKKH